MSKAQAAETGNTDHGTASEVEKQPAPGVRRSHRKGDTNFIRTSAYTKLTFFLGFRKTK